MNMSLDITLTVNGDQVSERVEARKTLVDFVRDDLGLTGSHIGCEHGVLRRLHHAGEWRDCARLPDAGGAMRRRRVLKPSKACRTPASLADLQAAFEQRNALAVRLLHARYADRRRRNCCQHNSTPSRDEIREHISGNYCRCTGYHAIVDAVEFVAKARAGAKS